MSDCPRICIPFEEFDPTIHKLIGIHATEAECLLACECASSSTSGQSSSSVSGQSSSSVSGQSSGSSVSGQSSSSVSGQSSSSSPTPFFTCEPEEASIRLTADFKFDGAGGPVTSVNNLILQRTPPGGIVPWQSGFGTANDPDPISWEGAINGVTIYILYLPNENQSDYWNRWLIGWLDSSASPIPFTNNFLTAYRATTVTAPPLTSVPWLAELTYEGVYDHAGMSLSSLNVEKYCI